MFNGRNWKQNLEYHFLTHTKEKPFKCPICPHSSALKYNLIRHIRNRHWEVLAPTLLDSSGERDGTESRNQGLSNRDMHTSLDQEVQLPTERGSLPADRGGIMPLSTSHGGNPTLSQQECQMNLNQNFQMQLPLSQEAQMSANNSQVVQMPSGSNQVPVVPMATGNTQPIQMSTNLNPLNVHEIPVSANQEMQVPVNELNSASQGSSLLTKEENQMLKKT